MSSWLRVAIATVTCLLLSPIACLPLHDVDDGGRERRELLHRGGGTWLDHSGVTTGVRDRGSIDGVGLGQPAGPVFLGGDNSRDSDAVLDLLLASLQDNTKTSPRDLYHQQQQQESLHKRGRQSKVDDYGHGLFWGKRNAGEATWLQQRDELKTGEKGEDDKRGGDEYGFGLFFGKRDGEDFDDFSL